MNQKTRLIIFLLVSQIGILFSQGLNPLWLSSIGSNSSDDVSRIVSTDDAIWYYGKIGDKVALLDSSDTLEIQQNSSGVYGCVNFEGKHIWQAAATGSLINPLCLIRGQDSTLLLFTSFLDSITIGENTCKTNQGSGLLVSTIDNVTGKHISSIQLEWGNYSQLIDAKQVGDYLLLAIEFSGTIKVTGDVISSKGKQDVLLVAINQSGEQVWHKRWGFKGITGVTEICSDSEDNVYIGFSNKPDNKQPAICKLAKYSIEGLSIFENTIYSASKGELRTSYIKDSTVYLGGIYRGELTIDSDTLVSQGLNDILMLGTDLNGHIEWHTTLAGYGNDWINTITAYDNYILAAGTTYGELVVNSDTIKQSSPAGTIFYLRLYEDGNLVEAKSINGLGNDFPKDFIIGADNNFYITGLFHQQLGCGKDSIISVGEEDVFFAKVLNCDAIRYKMTGDTMFCPGNSATLDAGVGYNEYYWIDGAAGERFAEIFEEGMYTVFVSDSLGCQYEDSIFVSKAKQPQPNLGADLSIAALDSLWLKPGDFDTYKWDSGQTEDSIKVIGHFILNDSAIYVVEVSKDNCFNSDTIVIHNNAGTTSLLLDGLTSFPTITNDLFYIKNNSELRGHLYIRGYLSDEKSLLFERHSDIIPGQSFQFDLSSYPSGTYHINAYEGVLSKSFVIIKL